eukprot:1500903-Rhodomonas_salina.1
MYSESIKIPQMYVLEGRMHQESFTEMYGRERRMDSEGLKIPQMPAFGHSCIFLCVEPLLLIAIIL